MITIPIPELKKFLHHAKNIKGNNIIPILSYIKLECAGESATLTKTNLASFVIFDVEADFKNDEIVLIEELTLAAINFSHGDTLKISVVGKNVILDDGDRKLKCQVIANNFPAIETNTGHDKVSLSYDVIASLSLAKTHSLPASEKLMRDWKCFVHVTKIRNKSFVVGVNGSVSYFKSFDENIPEMSLDPETVVAISKFKEVEYSSNNRYDYFQFLGITFGFIKTESTKPQLEDIVGRFKSDDSFVVNRGKLVEICEMVIALNDTAIPPEVSITDEGSDKLRIRFTDITGVEKSSELIEVEDKTFDVPEILFQPRMMLTALKDLGINKIKISKIFGNMILSSPEEKGYLGSVMELAKL